MRQGFTRCGRRSWWQLGGSRRHAGEQTSDVQTATAVRTWRELSSTVWLAAPTVDPMDGSNGSSVRARTVAVL
eukprot:7282183-Prymnesium_polylepis.1